MANAVLCLYLLWKTQHRFLWHLHWVDAMWGVCLNITKLLIISKVRVRSVFFFFFILLLFTLWALNTFFLRCSPALFAGRIFFFHVYSDKINANWSAELILFSRSWFLYFQNSASWVLHNSFSIRIRILKPCHARCDK